MSDRSRSTGKKEHGTYLTRAFMMLMAWRALSPKAQVLYIWLRMEWKGPLNNNNGSIRLSVRQAAALIGIGINAAAAAFRELQAKGFIVVTEMGALGISGEARGPSYELTDLEPSKVTVTKGRKLFQEWRPGYDYPVERHNANNPRGINGKSKAHHREEDNPVAAPLTFGKNPIFESETLRPNIVTFRSSKRSPSS